MRDKWSDRQNRICEGLSSVGEEVAGFYKAGLRIVYGECQIENAANFLLHAAREIDGGLRDILDADLQPGEDEKEKRRKSIFSSLGSDEFEGLAEDWYKATKELHKYAHRHGAWKEPRELNAVIPIWDNYELILERLVGSYFAIIERIERIGEIRNLDKDGVVDTLSNILAVPAYYNYFFRTEKDVKWFSRLSNKGYFTPDKIVFDELGNALFWYALDYLERISEQTAQKPKYGKELIEIIETLVQFSLNKRRISNYHIWWYCAKILNNLPIGIIKEYLSIEKFRSWLLAWTDSLLGAAITDISERLLPKFLGDDSTLAYAEAVIDAITEIRAEGKSNSSFNREEAVFVWDFYWVRDAFQKNYKLIGQKCSLNIVLRIADKLRKALEYKQKNPCLDIEIGKDIYQLKVSRIPAEGIKPEEIDFKDGQYECSVNQYSPDQLKDLKKHKYFPAYINIDPQVELKRFTFSAFNREAMVVAIKRGLPAEINWKSNEQLEKKMEDLHDDLFSDYSYIRIKSLATGARDHENGVEEVLTIILRDVLLAKCETKRDDGRQVIDAFLSNKYPFPVFKRFVLLCIDKFWADYAGLMDRLLELIPNALAKSDFEVEMHDILHNHNSGFSPALNTKLKELINAAPEHCVKKDETNIAHLKYLWLSPLRDNPTFSALYEEAMQKAQLTDSKPHEPERSSDFKVLDVVHKSPMSKEDMLQMPVPELVKYLKEFKGADFHHRTFEGEPDKEGLANTLQAAVRENPKNFTDELSAFVEVDAFYIRYLLRGIKEVWDDNQEIDWRNIFDFSADYLKRVADVIINKPPPLNQNKDEGQDNYLWVIGDIVELVTNGCREDKHAFDPKYFDKAEQIFDLILPLYTGQKRLDSHRDVLAYAWNSTLGRTIMAYVSFSLRVARATKKRPEDWGRQKYERFFNKGIEAFTLFGSYLPQMKYLDDNYAKDKIELFVQKGSGNLEWKMFMQGYLAESRVYQDVYSLMRKNYFKGLDNNVFEKQFDQKLVEHICIGYLLFKERLEERNSDGQDSLFWKMLTSTGSLGKQERWLQVADYFSPYAGRTVGKEDKASKEITNKIIEFWAWTYDQQDLVEANLGEDYCAFLGQMAQLTILFDKIDEELEKWLLLCAPHVDRHHKATYFIQYLTKFDDEGSVKRIGKIFLRVLENTTPMFKQENIELIVRRIYEKGDRNDADTICNTYGRRGFHFLKPVWEEHQKKGD